MLLLLTSCAGATIKRHYSVTLLVKKPYNYSMSGPGGMARGGRGAFMGNRGGNRGHGMKRNNQAKRNQGMPKNKI